MRPSSGSSRPSSGGLRPSSGERPASRPLSALVDSTMPSSSVPSPSGPYASILVDTDPRSVAVSLYEALFAAAAPHTPFSPQGAASVSAVSARGPLIKHALRLATADGAGAGGTLSLCVLILCTSKNLRPVALKAGALLYKCCKVENPDCRLLLDITRTTLLPAALATGEIGELLLGSLSVCVSRGFELMHEVTDIVRTAIPAAMHCPRALSQCCIIARAACGVCDDRIHPHELLPLTLDLLDHSPLVTNLARLVSALAAERDPDEVEDIVHLAAALAHASRTLDAQFSEIAAPRIAFALCAATSVSESGKEALLVLEKNSSFLLSVAKVGGTALTNICGALANVISDETAEELKPLVTQILALECPLLARTALIYNGAVHGAAYASACTLSDELAVAVPTMGVEDIASAVMCLAQLATVDVLVPGEAAEELVATSFALATSSSGVDALELFSAVCALLLNSMVVVSASDLADAVQAVTDTLAEERGDTALNAAAALCQVVSARDMVSKLRGELRGLLRAAKACGENAESLVWFLDSLVAFGTPF